MYYNLMCYLIHTRCQLFYGVYIWSLLYSGWKESKSSYVEMWPVNNEQGIYRFSAHPLIFSLVEV